MAGLSGLVAAAAATATATAAPSQASGWGMVGWGIAAVVLIVSAFLVIKFLKKILINTVLGILALIIINYFGTPLGLKVGINFITVIVSALLGLAGVGLLILLSLFGISLV
jgi:pro-sigmaK processing inhibitor BofA